MILITTVECWREPLLFIIDEAEEAAGYECDEQSYNDIADDLKRRVVSRLGDRGVTVERSYQQSIGSFAIVQDATPEERAAFDEILADESEASREAVRQKVESVQPLDEQIIING